MKWRTRKRIQDLQVVTTALSFSWERHFKELQRRVKSIDPRVKDGSLGKHRRGMSMKVFNQVSHIGMIDKDDLRFSESSHWRMKVKTSSGGAYNLESFDSTRRLRYQVVLMKGHEFYGSYSRLLHVLKVSWLRNREFLNSVRIHAFLT